MTGDKGNDTMNSQTGTTINNKGFTITELLVAMALSAVVMASIGYVYYTQQKTYIAQEQIAATQQNLRSALFFLEREIRMAGCNPSQSTTITVGILTANNNSITFDSDAGGGDTDGVDNDKDGSTDEADEAFYSDGTADGNVTFSLGDGDGDGDNDLLRNGNLIAENIDALDFVYLSRASPPVVLNPGGGNVSAANRSLIRSVEVTVVARAERADPGYIDSTDYRNQRNMVILAAPNDNFRRRQIDTTIKCRNL
jgi:prepilin-type N-terminal cleavage/methylation domain-containing protein